MYHRINRRNEGNEVEERRYTANRPGLEIHADVAVIGGGLGGCAAALAAAAAGKTVVITEETDWLGGQLTSQAVPPDEHRWIEQFGCTRSYRNLREGIRSYYRRTFPLTIEATRKPNLNPGNGSVSRLCHEPRVALAVLHEMLAPYVHSGKLKLLMRRVPIRAEAIGDSVQAVTVRHTESGREETIVAAFFLDATECGDLLPMTGTEYVTGAESISQTGEPHAVDGDPLPMDMQAFTYCFAMDHFEGENHTIERPRDYSFWRSYEADFWPGKLRSWTGVLPRTLQPREFGIFTHTADLWRYRRILDKTNFTEGAYSSDITIVNWQQNDYWLGPIIDVPEEERNKHLESAKQLSLSLLYWMQTEAPRPDGKIGYPGLRLRKDVVGTEDGLAMYPYIRESRRIKAEYTVLEQHISPDERKDGRAEHFHDSVGIGCYRIDLHPSTGNRHYIDISCLPFQIPLGALIPVRMQNLLPACKNLGVTHITNGCYRLHPVEWNIGEAVGYLASYCIDKQLQPSAVRNHSDALKDFQQLLTKAGVELSWPDIRAM
ncbi:FAD-dependent oxidoreductase [Paenibacillus oceani]|uniref:FAD-dependent oxidoreductase n=1 Tax=Paenibacillus oceani TaxID=2772510 RepID=A0A927CB29_9BACL|nr:FAD-dependent oxidoreductase [Paenibacillus oceani]